MRKLFVPDPIFPNSLFTRAGTTLCFTISIYWSIFIAIYWEGDNGCNHATVLTSVSCLLLVAVEFSPFQHDRLGLVMCLKMVCSVTQIWQPQIAHVINDFVVVHCPIHITWESKMGPNWALWVYVCHYSILTRSSISSPSTQPTCSQYSHNSTRQLFWACIVKHTWTLTCHSDNWTDGIDIMPVNIAIYQYIEISSQLYCSHTYWLISGALRTDYFP